MKIRAEINETENKQTETEKINKSKNWFFEIINKVGKSSHNNQEIKENTNHQSEIIEVTEESLQVLKYYKENKIL